MPISFRNALLWLPAISALLVGAALGYAVVGRKSATLVFAFFGIIALTHPEMPAKVGNMDSYSVIQALIKQSRKLPKELYRSLTWDRGCEMAGHKAFALATDVDIFLCEPHSPWQRGTNENTNRLLQQYFPKGTNLSIHSQAKLSAVARQLNERPRKTLGYETPAERFNACVASIC